MELEIQEAYSEVYEIINNMPKEYQEKIPENVKIFFKSHRKADYQVNINAKNLFDKAKLKEQTIAIIAMLNIKYWCPNEKIKKQLLETYNENEKIYQKELEEKYNPDNLFKNRQNSVIPATDTMQIVEYKRPKWYQKIFKNILSIFKRK